MKKRYIAFTFAFVFALMTTIATVSAATKATTIRVKGMTCKRCAYSIEKSLKETKGVKQVRINTDTGEAWVKYDDEKVTVARLREVINGTGFKTIDK